MGDSANLGDKNLKTQILADSMGVMLTQWFSVCVEYTVIASCLCNSLSGYNASNRFVMVIDETVGVNCICFLISYRITSCSVCIPEMVRNYSTSCNSNSPLKNRIVFSSFPGFGLTCRCAQLQPWIRTWLGLIATTNAKGILNSKYYVEIIKSGNKASKLA